MIASVSTFSRSIGATRPLCTVNLSIAVPGLSKLPHVDEMSVDRGGRGHGGTHEVRAATRALPAFEVAIAGRRATLPRLQPVGVHRQAHRAARLAPFETRGLEDLV